MKHLRNAAIIVSIVTQMSMAGTIYRFCSTVGHSLYCRELNVLSFILFEPP